jgi:ABC-2 type transport system permease protein
MATGVGRYLRLTGALARYSLARELAFRGNFLVKMFVEVLWLSILLVFYRTVFSKTTVVAGWDEWQYLFFVGCYFALEGLVETLFLENCNEFSDLVRSGDLDFYLLKPIDEQFLLTCRKIDWSTAPNVLMGIGVMSMALVQSGWSFDATRLTVFVCLFLCGLATAYSFLLLLMSTAIWFVRNQSLFELWWLFTSLMRYPREVFVGPWATPLGVFFTFIVPILLVVNVPARAMVGETLDRPIVIGFAVAATVLLLFLSRRFFLFSLRRYRSASS